MNDSAQPPHGSASPLPIAGGHRNPGRQGILAALHHDPHDRGIRQPGALDSRAGNALHLFHVRDGKVTEAWTVHHDLYAFDDFWS